MSDIKLLMRKVIENSVSDNWHSAVNEWDIVSMEEDEEANSECLCENTGLRYLYEIQNNENGNILFPIGSTCIKKFQRADLNEELKNREMMFKLVNAVKNHIRIELKSEYFSRKFLKYLYDNDVFQANEYNRNSSYNEYIFILNMFNEREITQRYAKRVIAIIMNSILPYARTQIRGER